MVDKNKYGLFETFTAITRNALFTITPYTDNSCIFSIISTTQEEMESHIWIGNEDILYIINMLTKHYEKHKSQQTESTKQ